MHGVNLLVLIYCNVCNSQQSRNHLSNIINTTVLVINLEGQIPYICTRDNMLSVSSVARF